MLSWFREVEGRGCQLFRVDLTTAHGGDAGRLLKDYQELRRRVERVFGYHIEDYKVRTIEGNGLLHMVWAINADHAAYIPQSWLSEQWEAIHGAKIVYIKRVRQGRRDRERISRYFVSQYFVNQDAVVSATYSWRRCRVALGKAWSTFKSQMMKGMERSDSLTTSTTLSRFNRIITYVEMIRAWGELLETGWCSVANADAFICGRQVHVIFS